MKEFKTLSPTQFGVGDGVKTRFSVARPGDIVRDSNIESVRRVGWQGDQLLRPYPRTNLAIASNDFTNSAWQGSPSLYMDFLSGTMPSSVDFSRASTATYVGRDGLIHTAAINEPRFTYDPATGQSEGLLVEGQATNLLLWSEDFTQGAWSTGASAVTETAMPSPVTGVNWKEVTTTTTGSYHGRLTQNVALTPGGLTIYAFVKAANHQFMRIRLAKSGELDPDIIFDLGDGSFHVRLNNFSVEVSPSSKRIGDAWRITVAIDASHITPGACSVHIGSADNKSTTITSAGNSFLLAAAQLEEGTHPTSYIPTEGSQGTRVADDGLTPLSAFPYNQQQGTFVVTLDAECARLWTPRFATPILSITNDLTGRTNAICLYTTGGSRNNVSVRQYYDNTTVGTASVADGLPSEKTGPVTLAFTYDRSINRLRVFANGLIGEVTPSDMPVMDAPDAAILLSRLGIKNDPNYTAPQQKFQKIEYYPRVLSDSELIALTEL